MYFSMAEMSVAEMSIDQNVRGRNVRGRNVLDETSVAEMSVAEMPSTLQGYTFFLSFFCSKTQIVGTLCGNPGRFARGSFRRVVSPWVVTPLLQGWVVSPLLGESFRP